MARLPGEPRDWPRLWDQAPPPQRRWIMPAAWVVLVLLMVLPPECDAQAQDATGYDLARVAAGEAGLRASADEVGAIHAVLTDRAARMDVSYGTALRWYAGRHVDRSRTDRRRWVAWLRRDGHQPRHWPRHLPWSAHRSAWRDLLRTAGEYASGVRAPPCAPHHWGSRADLRRFYERHPEARVVDCGATRNFFLRLPAFASGRDPGRNPAVLRLRRAPQGAGSTYLGGAIQTPSPFVGRDVSLAAGRASPYPHPSTPGGTS